MALHSKWSSAFNWWPRHPDHIKVFFDAKNAEKAAHTLSSCLGPNWAGRVEQHPTSTAGYLVFAMFESGTIVTQLADKTYIAFHNMPGFVHQAVHHDPRQALRQLLTHTVRMMSTLLDQIPENEVA